MQVQTFRDSVAISPRYPSNSKVTIFPDNVGKSVWQLHNHRSRSRWNLVYSPEDTKRRSISVALPNSLPIKRYDKKKKTVLYIKQVDAPLNFANSIWIFHLVFWSACAHKHKACLFYWFFTQYMVAFVSFGSLGRLYLGPKERMKKRQAFHLLVGAWSTSRLKITSQYVRNI